MAEQIRDKNIHEPDLPRGNDFRILIENTEQRTAEQLERGMTQAQLAEAVGVGVTHISHVETGNSIPSLQAFLDIVNTLGCSADELLCIEVKKSRPIFESWLNEQLADCSEQEVKLISDVVIGLKTSLRRLDLTGSKE